MTRRRGSPSPSNCVRSEKERYDVHGLHVEPRTAAAQLNTTRKPKLYQINIPFTNLPKENADGTRLKLDQKFVQVVQRTLDDDVDCLPVESDLVHNVFRCSESGYTDTGCHADGYLPDLPRQPQLFF